MGSGSLALLSLLKKVKQFYLWQVIASSSWLWVIFFFAVQYIYLLSVGRSGLIVSESLSVVSNSLQPHGLYNPWNSSGQNSGVGSLSLLQGIFPTQGSNLGLPHCRHILYQLSYKVQQKLFIYIRYGTSLCVF